MMRRIFLFAIVAIVLSGVAAYAHHSYAATYDVGKEVKLEGKLIQFVFRNPHSYVTIQAPDATGAVQRWAVEWAGTSQLSNRGITQETLKVGDAITIVGRPSRVPGEYRLLMVNLTRPSDGFSWGTRSGEVVD
ncbi:MAG TPA: DUF6152 family protein [Terriglobia bacterium]|nr:DUF6152 family protein [Terriglobia bacterium]